MALQKIIVQLTAEVEKHHPVYRPQFNEAIHALERVMLDEDDMEEFLKEGDF